MRSLAISFHSGVGQVAHLDGSRESPEKTCTGSISCKSGYEADGR
jgi:hypothetical protein